MNVTQTRTHDEQYRLTRTAGSGFPAHTISYVAGTNRMNKLNNKAVSYDGMGNVTNSGNNLTASIEVNGRLQTATVPNTRRVTLLYSGSGELARARTETRSGNQWTTQYWEYASFAPDGRALGLIQENTARTEWEWIWLDNLPVVQFQDSYNSSGTYTGTTVTYLHPDQLGTPRIGTDSAGAISWRYRSDAFGIPTISGSHTVRLRLPGQIDLGTGGINYNYFMDYDPNVGRYLTADRMSVAQHVRRRQSTLGTPGQAQLELNLYLYAAANPLRFVDPTGMYSCTYSIAAHTMTCTPNTPGNASFSSSDFVSGRNGAGCNDSQDNRDRTNVSDYGPIPTVNYNIGGPTANGRRNLTPDPGNGRFAFQLHACANTATYSCGCIASPNTWNQLNNLLSNEEGNDTLTVTP